MASAQDDKFIKAVKLFNVVAGILLIGGTITLVVALIVRDPVEKPEDTAKALVSSSKPGIDMDGDIELPAPPGSQIMQAQLQGQMALVTVRTVSEGDILYVVDIVSGHVKSLRLTKP